VDDGAQEGGVMGERFSLTDGVIDKAELLERAVAALRDGKLIIAPLEHAYVFVADAFNHAAVKKIHLLRQDARGVAAQVLVGDIQTVIGITLEFGTTINSICERFWPGLLTVNIPPARGLVWDLGDERTLEEIAVRVPAAEFIREVALASGPLAIGSATLSGRPPTRKSRFFPCLDSDYAAIFDQGDLEDGPSSTVISVKDDGVMLRRQGAISLADLRSITPNIAVPA
jgi:tRNA threonylcarbamoyl adenosine modification protein (Sua5/YciO/YrdC/YwlC family)